MYKTRIAMSAAYVRKSNFLNIFVIYMYIAPGGGRPTPGVQFFFSELPTFSPFAHFLQDLPFKGYFYNFPHSNAWASYVDLAVKYVKVIQRS